MYIPDQTIRSVADLSPAFQTEFLTLCLQHDTIGPALVFALGA